MTEQSTLTLTAQSVSGIPTPHASRYLQQLCKHFAHKRPVSFDPHAGQITFGSGECQLGATADTLTISLASPDEPQLEQLKDVVVRHLVRFAFREELAVNWRPV